VAPWHGSCSKGSSTYIHDLLLDISPPDCSRSTNCCCPRSNKLSKLSKLPPVPTRTRRTRYPRPAARRCECKYWTIACACACAARASGPNSAAAQLVCVCVCVCVCLPALPCLALSCFYLPRRTRRATSLRLYIQGPTVIPRTAASSHCDCPACPTTANDLTTLPSSP
jgi:hypothetical protein